MLKSFRIGGIHPPENKLSAGKNIQTAALPKQAVILLGQHIGAPAQVVVNKGDSVKVGTLLAKAGGFVSMTGVCRDKIDKRTIWIVKNYDSKNRSDYRYVRLQTPGNIY